MQYRLPLYVSIGKREEVQISVDCLYRENSPTLELSITNSGKWRYPAKLHFFASGNPDQELLNRNSVIYRQSVRKEMIRLGDSLPAEGVIIKWDKTSDSTMAKPDQYEVKW